MPHYERTISLISRETFREISSPSRPPLAFGPFVNPTNSPIIPLARPSSPLPFDSSSPTLTDWIRASSLPLSLFFSPFAVHNDDFESPDGGRPASKSRWRSVCWRSRRENSDRGGYRERDRGKEVGEKVGRGAAGTGRPLLVLLFIRDTPHAADTRILLF